MIEDERVEKAVHFIAKQAAHIGKLRGQKAHLEHKLKIVRSQVFLRSEGTVAEREAIALASSEYIETAAEYRDCVTELDTLYTTLKAGELLIEVWRSQSANNRRANV